MKFFGAQATGCSPISTAVKAGSAEIEPQKPATIARSLAIGNPADGHYAIKAITKSGGWSEDVSDREVVESIQLLAETEGIFTETAGGVTVGCARKLYATGRISPDETTVLCITGNGLKTTDALAGKYAAEDADRAASLRSLNAYLQKTLDVPGNSGGLICMAITVQIPTALRRHTEGVGKVRLFGSKCLGELFSVLDQKFPELKPHLRDEAGQIRRFLNVYVNEEDIRFLGGQRTRFRMGTRFCWCRRSRAAAASMPLHHVNLDP